ncbi:hypothetical protein TGME49_250930 [Toxoplasma gondii ME49]|uniref:Transmembrane protein n=2 Tax=Toxoplasma gondii TaxID=5811 RepID=B6KHQ1_TOXGV|nr:hypothetical protein TGME49_250930 [Toxoplasma gondii ME49]EPT25201.1 hypothetical protein TGME49_250930 [Toxoplasma gondii ME49]ESS34487.1 hypothetical protein TGVEG_250930 [Toxoplasma gondii VEG]|eukprot:XP_002367374.1 hypothetical protein TGME49_250930 [Toxoplasma gondii ME49]
MAGTALLCLLNFFLSAHTPGMAETPFRFRIFCRLFQLPLGWRGDHPSPFHFDVATILSHFARDSTRGLSCDTESLAFSGELTFTRLPGTVRQNSTARHLQPHGRPTKVFIRISVHTKTPSTKRSNG